MKNFTLIILCLLLAACGGKQSATVEENDIIVFDNSLSYPKADIKLSDIADVKYIKMKGLKDGFMLKYLSAAGSALFVDEQKQHIYIKEDNKLLVFDMDGNPVRILDRQGRGPQEYVGIGAYWQSLQDDNSIYIEDGNSNKYVVFDTLFNFKKTIPFENIAFGATVPLKDDLILHHSFVVNEEKFPNAAPYAIFSQQTGERVEILPVELHKPYVPDWDGALDYNKLPRGLGGNFMCNMRSDTVKWIDAETLEIRPRFVDKTKYKDENIMALPAFETEKYVLFSLIFQSMIITDVEMKYFLYDKEKREIFSLPITNLDDVPFFNWDLTQNRLKLNSWNTTLNGNYAAIYIQATDLIDFKDTFPEELKKIAQTMTDDDNPVLMLMKLK